MIKYKKFFKYLFVIIFLLAIIPSIVFSNSEISPHWPHIRTMITEWRIEWYSQQKNQEFDWVGKHYDYMMIGPKSNTIKSKNPNIKTLVYTINWTVMQTGQFDIGGDVDNPGHFLNMQRWFNNHPQYNIEDAFLHDANKCPTGTPKTQNCRIQLYIWDTYRWVINPRDEGAKKYKAESMREFVNKLYDGYPVDGIFLDETGSCGSMESLYNYKIREYSDSNDQFIAYQNDTVELLKIIKSAIGDKILQLNPSECMSNFDRQMLRAAGAAHMEMINNPTYEMSDRWDWIEQCINDGVFTQVLVAEYDSGINYPSGNYTSSSERYLMTALASYYMVSPINPNMSAFTPVNIWSEPYWNWWLKATEVNVGKPVEKRKIYQTITDPNKRTCNVYSRNFENALILIRDGCSWDYRIFNDTTKVQITLPTDDTYYFLKADGTTGSQVNNVTLRNSEGIILIKGSRLNQDEVPPNSPRNLRIVK